MFDWIYSNREAFLSNYVEIGRNHTAAKKLQEEHNQFTVASNVSILTLHTWLDLEQTSYTWRYHVNRPSQ